MQFTSSSSRVILGTPASRFYSYTRALTKRRLLRVARSTKAFLKYKKCIAYHPNNLVTRDYFYRIRSKHKELVQKRDKMPANNNGTILNLGMTSRITRYVKNQK